MTLTNRGPDPLKVGKVRIVNGEAADFRIAANSCTGNRLAVGESCVVSVRFAPSAPGPRSSTLEIHSDSVDSPDEVTLRRQGNRPSRPLGATTERQAASPQQIYRVGM